MSEIAGVLVGLDGAEIDRHLNSRIGSNRKPVKIASKNSSKPEIYRVAVSG